MNNEKDKLLVPPPPPPLIPGTNIPLEPPPPHNMEEFLKNAGQQVFSSNKGYKRGYKGINVGCLM